MMNIFIQAIHFVVAVHDIVTHTLSKTNHELIEGNIS